MKHSIVHLGLSSLLMVLTVSGQAQYRPGGASSSAAAGGSGSEGDNGGFGGTGQDPDYEYNSFDEGADAGYTEEGSLEETIPGVPGDDYPIYAEVPDTSFLCDGLVEGGYYADPEAECQAFHICGSDGNGGLTKYSFLCPNGTIFQQQYFVCDWWFNVDCSLAEDLYSLNEDIAAEREANNGAGGSDGGSYEDVDNGQADQQTRGQTGGKQGRGQGGQGGQQGRGQGGQGGVRGQTGGQGGSRGGRPGSKRGGSQPGYLAPGSGPSDNGGDYDDSSLGVDTGYGAPGGDGDFPPLSQYSRKTRDSQYQEIMDIEA